MLFLLLDNLSEKSDFVSSVYDMEYFNEILIYTGSKYHSIFCLLFLAIVIAGMVYIFRLKHRNLLITQKSEQVLKNITNNIPGGVITLIADQHFTITYANEGFMKLIGHIKDEYEIVNDKSGLAYIHSEDIPKVKKMLIKSKEKHHETIEFEFRIVRKDGNVVPVLLKGAISEDEVGVPFYYCLIIDITEQKKIVQKLKRDKERYQIITERSDVVIFDVDHETRKLHCSSKYKQLFGRKPPEYLTSFENVHIDDCDVLADMILGISNGKDFVKGNLRIKKADNEYLWCEVQVSTTKNSGNIIRINGKITNIDKEQRELEHLKELSTTDTLTGLYNKKATYELIDSYLNGSGKFRNSALVFIDIDNFKAINDSLGHVIGDELLVEVARIIKKIFRKDDIAGRFGGDEFCIFVPDISLEVLEKKARILCYRLYKSYKANKQTITISASIGIACYPNDAESREFLIKKADKALYAAKENGKNQVVFYDQELKLKGYDADRP